MFFLVYFNKLRGIVPAILAKLLSYFLVLYYSFNDFDTIEEEDKVFKAFNMLNIISAAGFALVCMANKLHFMTLVFTFWSS